MPENLAVVLQLRKVINTAAIQVLRQILNGGHDPATERAQLLKFVTEEKNRPHVINAVELYAAMNKSLETASGDLCEYRVFRDLFVAEARAAIGYRRGVMEMQNDFAGMAALERTAAKVAAVEALLPTIEMAHTLGIARTLDSVHSASADLLRLAFLQAE